MLWRIEVKDEFERKQASDQGGCFVLQEGDDEDLLWGHSNWGD